MALATSESNLMPVVPKTTQPRRLSHGKNVAVVSGQLDMVATAIKRLSSKSHESLATMG